LGQKFGGSFPQKFGAEEHKQLTHDVYTVLIASRNRPKTSEGYAHDIASSGIKAVLSHFISQCAQPMF